MSGDLGARQLPENVGGFLRRVAAWAARRSDVRAIVLVGSHGRGEARADSDIDLMLLVDQPTVLTADNRWTETLGPVRQVQMEKWGRATSVRVWFTEGLEVEFSLAAPDWARPPLDEGTARVLRDGYQVIYDPEGLLVDIGAHLPGRPQEEKAQQEAGLPVTYQPNPHSEFRVKFDFRVDFTNGGYVQGRDFLLDLERPEVSDAELAVMIVDAMNLARAGRVRIRRKRVVRRGGHDDASAG